MLPVQKSVSHLTGNSLGLRNTAAATTICYLTIKRGARLQKAPAVCGTRADSYSRLRVVPFAVGVVTFAFSSHSDGLTRYAEWGVGARPAGIH